MKEQNERITVFTPTYNRANSIHRVYNSLLKQTYKNFLWLIIDDGSSDNTKDIVEEYIKQNEFKIIYKYQENQGKHIAINNAVKMTNSELFLIADSDDAFLPNSLEVFVKSWDSIPNDEKNFFKGIIARTFDSQTKIPNGRNFPQKEFCANELDANFKLKVGGEKWSIFKTDVLREFPFPNISGLKFYPETIVWQKIARKYKTKYVDIPLREYFRDQENALTNKNKSRHRENIYLWEHLINNVFDYFQYDPKLFIKACIGLTRDGLLNGFKIKKVMSIPNRFYKKILVFIFYPMGFILYKKTKKCNMQVL